MCPWYSPRHREGRYALKLISSARGRYASAAELLLCSVNPTALGVGWSMPHDTTRTNQRGAYSTASPWNSADECVPHTGWDGTSGEIRRSNPVDKSPSMEPPHHPPESPGWPGSIAGLSLLSLRGYSAGSPGPIYPACRPRSMLCFSTILDFLLRSHLTHISSTTDS